MHCFEGCVPFNLWSDPLQEVVLTTLSILSQDGVQSPLRGSNNQPTETTEQPKAHSPAAIHAASPAGP